MRSVHAARQNLPEDNDNIGQILELTLYPRHEEWSLGAKGRTIPGQEESCLAPEEWDLEEEIF